MATTVLNAAAGSSSAKTWEKATTDTYADSIKTARDMGQARLNYSRLNMVTTLSKNETEDWFSFKVTSRGKIRLTAINLTEASKENKDSETETNATDELDAAATDFEKAIEKFKGQGLKVEVYQYVSNRQTMIATNDEKNNKQYEAFEQLMRGEYKAKQPGTYYVHVTTKDGKPVSEDTLYALQVQMGDKYKHDYLTKESSVDHTKVTKGDIALAKAEAEMGAVQANSKVLAAQAASDLLSAGYTSMATIRSTSGKNPAAKILNLLA